MIKHLTLVFIIAIFLFYVPSRIFASDVNILCNSTGCSGLTDKIFDTQNMVPGDSIQKTISIKNEVGESININLLADKDAATDDAFAQKASIVLYKDTSLIYSNYFMNFLDESSVSLGTIGNGQTAEYKIEISLAKELGNEIDATLTYDYTEDVQLGLSAGAFIPGDAFSGANDKTATQVIGSMKVTF